MFLKILNKKLLTYAGASCEDNSKHKVHCPGWAKNGECQKNPGFMKINCRKSCNTCGKLLMSHPV